MRDTLTFRIVRTLRVAGLMEPISHFSDAVVAGTTLYVSGVVATDERGDIVGRGDVEEYGPQDWVYDDPAEASDDREAPGHSRGGRTFRCRRCHNTWGQAR